MAPPPYGSLVSLLAALTVVHSLPTPSVVFAASASTLPQVDWSALGTVGLFGNFAGLSVYNASSSGTTFDPTVATLLGRDESGDLNRLGATNAGGSISAICTRNSTGVVYVGGTFTALSTSTNSTGPTTFANLASYTPSSSTFTPLGSLTGPVHALSCAEDLLWIAGDFPASSATGANVATYNYGTNAFSAPPFGGLNGPVWAVEVAQGSRGESILFGGGFSVAFSSSLNGANGTTTNTSAASAAAISAGASSNFSSLGSSLTPISLTGTGSELSATPSSSISGFSDPDVIYCPRGADGRGNTWLVDEPFEHAVVTVRVGRAVSAGGVRIGNTFVGGGGTRGFKIVSLPDNQVMTLTTRNPTTGEIQICQFNCTLSHSTSIPYEDFLFPNGTYLTGFQLNIFSHYGPAAGLHLLQLLSNGNEAYAVGDYNQGTNCTSGLGAGSGTSSNASTTGTWTTATANANVSGTTEDVLQANVPAGTSAANGPTITWTIPVEQSGVYDVSFYTPGCLSMGDCATRTQVALTVTAAGGTGSPTSTTVNQGTQNDISSLLYSGSLVASGAGGGVTVSMRLAANAASDVDMVADKILLRAHSTNGSAVGSSTQSRGVFEYVLSDSGAFGDGSFNGSVSALGTVAGNGTGVDSLGAALGTGAVVRALTSFGAVSFVGGEFTFTNGTTSAANVAAYERGISRTVPGGGLNGRVQALAIADGWVYAGGLFTASQDASVTGMAGLARWQYTSTGGAWEGIGSTSGLGGNVTALSVTSLGGSAVVYATGAGNEGMAIYSTSNSTWLSNAAGFFAGNLSALSATSTEMTYVAGNVGAAASFAAPGGVMLSGGSDDAPTVTPLGFGFDEAASEAAATATGASLSNRTERSVIGSWVDVLMPRQASVLEKRQSVAGSSDVQTTLPSALSSLTEGEILAGGFWKNDVVLGGRFVTSTGIKNVGIYTASNSSLRALNGGTLDGEVRSIKVVDDTAWIGGEFTSPSGQQGLDTYDLSKDQWASTTLPALGPYSGTNNVTINVVTSRPSDESIIVVAGAFATAGSLTCAGICIWDNSRSQWQALGTGLSGVVGSIDFAGGNSEFLIAAGSFTINGTQTYVAQWNFGNSTWSLLGNAADIPGPATAVSADNANESSIWLAGTSAGSSVTPYLMHWDGSAWSNQGSELATGSGVQQLAFVPLSDTHDAKALIEKDRMLMVSGKLSLNDGGSISSALFDGVSWYPYLSTFTSSGSAGVVSALLYSAGTFRLSAKDFYSVGIVILISMAIALGIVFLGVLCGLLVALKNRNQEQSTGYPLGPVKEENDSFVQQPPTTLLANITAATAALTEKSTPPRQPAEASLMADRSPTTPNTPMGATGVGLGLAGAGAAGEHEEEEMDEEPDIRRTRWSFAQERDGEISVAAGEEVEVLNRDEDAEWALVRRADGTTGAIPADWLI